MARTSTHDRKLKVYAFDPGVSRQLRYSRLNEIIVSIPHEMEASKRIGAPKSPGRGPIGEYIEVIDYDPSSGLFYPPIDLNDFVATSGLSPSEANPQFHQQMVYAVSMTTIAAFEEALGRVALWSPKQSRDASGNFETEEYVGRLRIYPHALREANAYYSPKKKALLFGYFAAGSDQPGLAPGSIVFTCLSHDIIAHETTHALLDGMHARFAEATNMDVLALHEAIADIVALFQHFSHPEVLYDQIARSRGDLESESMLGQLAQEFGRALGRGHALRDAIGGISSDGKWKRSVADRTKFKMAKRPHDRGAILVAAIFDAYLAIYSSRTGDLFRIATNGTGVLPPGALLPDLVKRLADEAAKSAKHLLRMCIRALDYCPPVDVRFGDYLRAIITADHDLFPEDEYSYRTAIIEAFVAWGIVPEGMRTVSAETLLWPSLDELIEDMSIGGEDESLTLSEGVGTLIENPAAILEWIGRHAKVPDKVMQSLTEIATQIRNQMAIREDTRISSSTSQSAEKSGVQHWLTQNLLNLGLEADRHVEWLAQRFYAQIFWAFLTSVPNRQLVETLGLTLDRDAVKSITRSASLGSALPALSVQSVRMATRKGSRDQLEREYVVEVIQKRHGYFDAAKQLEADTNGKHGSELSDFSFRRGCTLLIDARTFKIRRVIRTRGDVTDERELNRMRDYLVGRISAPDNALFSRGVRLEETTDFAALHRSIGGEP